MKLSIAILSVLLCLSLPASAHHASWNSARLGADDFTADAEDIDWSDFDTTAEQLNAKIDKEVHASLCSRHQPPAHPGDVIIRYNRAANGGSVGTLTLAAN